ncbi:hemerythrin domain-containing protein [Gordonia sp. VNK1]|uniref:hemerythrin domain-containing protein n=1 Tax=Gordonia oleivorans TaxID=3156618 RepID=UPI0032B490DA
MTTVNTTHQTMNTVIHAAFRRTLARFDTALGDFDTTAPERARQLTAAWDMLAAELHHHHSYEEDIFWPVLQKLCPDLAMVEELDGEHDAMRAALDRADRSMQDFASAATPESAQKARVAVGHLSDVLLNHLAHEERDLEPISARYQETPEMKAATKTVIKSELGRLGQLIAWLQDGADDNDRRGLRKQIPDPVVFVANAVGGRRYRREIAPIWV